jgi:hypothetical protein
VRRYHLSSGPRPTTTASGSGPRCVDTGSTTENVKESAASHGSRIGLTSHPGCVRGGVFLGGGHVCVGGWGWGARLALGVLGTSAELCVPRSVDVVTSSSRHAQARLRQIATSHTPAEGHSHTSRVDTYTVSCACLPAPLPLSVCLPLPPPPLP